MLLFRKTVLLIMIAILVFLPIVSRTGAVGVSPDLTFLRLDPGERVVLKNPIDDELNDIFLFFRGSNANFYAYSSYYGQTSTSTQRSINASIYDNHLSEYVEIINYSTTDYLYVDFMFFTGSYGYTKVPSPFVVGSSTNPVGGLDEPVGSLELSLDNSTQVIPAIKLDGSVKKLETALPKVTIADTTGKGTGWNLSVKANPFKEVTPIGGFKSGTTARTFSTEIFTLQPKSFTALNGNSLTGINVNMNRQSLLNSNPITLVSATTGNGKGSYVLDFNISSLQLDVLNKPYIDKVNYPSGETPYETVITWTISVGP